MKLSTLWKIITLPLLLLVFAFSNLYAVQSTTIDLSKTEDVATISSTRTATDSPRKSKRESRLIERFKERLASLFSKNNTQENIVQNDNIETKNHGLAIASLVLGIIAIPTFYIGIGFLFSLLAIIFGAIAKGKIKSSGGFYTGKGMAIAGIILGIIPLVLLVFALFLLFAFNGF